MLEHQINLRVFSFEEYQAQYEMMEAAIYAKNYVTGTNAESPRPIVIKALADLNNAFGLTFPPMRPHLTLVTDEDRWWDADNIAIALGEQEAVLEQAEARRSWLEIMKEDIRKRCAFPLCNGKLWLNGTTEGPFRLVCQFKRANHCTCTLNARGWLDLLERRRELTPPPERDFGVDVEAELAMIRDEAYIYHSAIKRNYQWRFTHYDPRRHSKQYLSLRLLLEGIWETYGQNWRDGVVLND